VKLPGGGSISQEVKPEDKMASDSQNGAIITLSVVSLSFVIGTSAMTLTIGKEKYHTFVPLQREQTTLFSLTV
jgi:hypothetical protein